MFNLPPRESDLAQQRAIANSLLPRPWSDPHGAPRPTYTSNGLLPDRKRHHRSFRAFHEAHSLDTEDDGGYETYDPTMFASGGVVCASATPDNPTYTHPPSTYQRLNPKELRVWPEGEAHAKTVAASFQQTFGKSTQVTTSLTARAETPIEPGTTAEAMDSTMAAPAAATAVEQQRTLPGNLAYAANGARYWVTPVYALQLDNVNPCAFIVCLLAQHILFSTGEMQALSFAECTRDGNTECTRLVKSGDIQDFYEAFKLADMERTLEFVDYGSIHGINASDDVPVEMLPEAFLDVTALHTCRSTEHGLERCEALMGVHGTPEAIDRIAMALTTGMHTITLAIVRDAHGVFTYHAYDSCRRNQYTGAPDGASYSSAWYRSDTRAGLAGCLQVLNKPRALEDIALLTDRGVQKKGSDANSVGTFQINTMRAKAGAYVVTPERVGALTTTATFTLRK